MILRAWLAVAAWTLIVIALGGDSFSEDSTSRFLGPLLRWLLPDSTAEMLPRYQEAIRKTAHVVEYAVLAVLGYWALCLSSAGTRLRHAALTVALVCVVAGADEARQARSAARTGSFRDVGLDVTAGLAGLVAVVSVQRWPRVSRWFPALPRSE